MVQGTGKRMGNCLMYPFNLPLSNQLDFGVDPDGSAFFKTWDGRPHLHLTSDEFKTLFSLLSANREEIARGIETLSQGDTTKG
jgi:hypothetical protein